MRRCLNTRNDLVDVIKELGEDACEVEVRIQSGSDCCRIKGIICGLIKNCRILIIIDTDRDVKCFIPINKIAAICKKCGCGRR